MQLFVNNTHSSTHRRDLNSNPGECVLLKSVLPHAMLILSSAEKTGSVAERCITHLIFAASHAAASARVAPMRDLRDVTMARESDPRFAKLRLPHGDDRALWYSKKQKQARTHLLYFLVHDLFR
jgi:hypothetical protein